MTSLLQQVKRKGNPLLATTKTQHGEICLLLPSGKIETAYDLLGNSHPASYKSITQSRVNLQAAKMNF